MCGVDSSGLGYRKVTGSCEHDNQISCSQIAEDFPERIISTGFAESG